MRSWFLALALVPALAGIGWAQDAEEPTYADKPASWWIDELAAGEQPKIASDVLRQMGPEVAPLIARALGETRVREARERLLLALTRYRSVGREVVVALVPVLDGKNARNIDLALDIVRKSGEHAVVVAPQIGNALQHSSSSVRRSAAIAVGGLGKEAEPHIAHLARLLDDTKTRRVAISAMLRLGPHAGAAFDDLMAHVDGRDADPHTMAALCAIAPEDSRVGDEVLAAIERWEDDDGTSVFISLFRRSMQPNANMLALGERLSTHAEPAWRTVAVEALVRWADDRKEIPDALIRLLQDEDLGVARIACNATKGLGKTAQAAMPRLQDAYADAPHQVAFIQMYRGLLPTSGNALMEAALRGPDDVRQMAWHALMRTGEGWLGDDAEHVKALLFDTSIDLDERVSFVRRLDAQGTWASGKLRGALVDAVLGAEVPLAVAAVQSLGHADADIDVFLAALQRDSTEMRRSAIDALAHMIVSQERARQALVELLQHEDESTQHRALFALAWPLTPQTGGPPRVAVPEAAEHLARFIASDAPHVPEAAIRLLGSLSPDEQPPDALVAWLVQPQLGVQAVEAVGRSTADVDPLLAELIDSDNGLAAARACETWLYREAPADRVSATLRALIDDDDPGVARAAVLAVLRLEDDQLMEFGGGLKRVVERDLAGATHAACHGLGRLAPWSPDAAQALLDVAARPDHSAHTGVAGLLPDLGEAGVRALVELLDSKSRDARRNAIVVITGAVRNGVEGLGAAEPRLVRLSDTDDLEIARLAKSALTAIREE